MSWQHPTHCRAGQNQDGSRRNHWALQLRSSTKKCQPPPTPAAQADTQLRSKRELSAALQVQGALECPQGDQRGPPAPLMCLVQWIHMGVRPARSASHPPGCTPSSIAPPTSAWGRVRGCAGTAGCAWYAASRSTGFVPICPTTWSSRKLGPGFLFCGSRHTAGVRIVPNEWLAWPDAGQSPSGCGRTSSRYGSPWSFPLHSPI